MAWRRGKVVPLKENVDQAIEILKQSKKIAAVVVRQRCKNGIGVERGATTGGTI